MMIEKLILTLTKQIGNRWFVESFNGGILSDYYTGSIIDITLEPDSESEVMLFSIGVKASDAHILIEVNEIETVGYEDDITSNKVKNTEFLVKIAMKNGYELYIHEYKN